MRTSIKIVLSVTVALLIFAGGLGAGYLLHGYILNNQPSPTAAQEFSLYWEAWNRVNEQFYGDIPPQKATTYGAIRGSLQTLEDPYTIFIEPEPAAQEKAQLEGQFGGIGAYVRRDEAGRVLLEPMRGQPAEAAGMKIDDELVAIEGTPVLPEMTTDEIVLLIRGEIGTTVTITILRTGVAEPIDLVIERAIIETPSAHWRMLEEEEDGEEKKPRLGYIQLTSFTERSNDELDQAFAELSAQGAEAYIFDLRNNNGGLLETSVDVSSQFLRDGVVLREDRKNEGERVYNVRGSGKALDQPLVLLVNGGTASAAEIVAGALQDRGRAKLIGEKTYGKGSVQLIYELSDNSRLHVTVAKWFTPNGRAIDGAGLTPDLEVLYTEADHANNRDPQLAAAINLLRNNEAVSQE
jgi:carboxyl-terminal processing protease